MDLSVNIDSFDSYTSDMKGCEAVLNSVRNMLTTAQGKLDSRFLRDCGVYRQISTVSERLTKEKNGIKKMRTALGDIKSKYRAMEETNLRNCGGKPITSISSGSGGAGGGGGGGFSDSSDDNEGFKIWEWSDTWKIVNQFGIVGSFFSTLGSAITGGLSDGKSWMKMGKGFSDIINKGAKLVSKAEFGWKNLIGWTSKEKTSFWGAMGEKIDELDFGKATKVSDKIAVGAKWASYAFTVGAEAFENYEENKGNTGRIIGETVIESGVTIGMGLVAGAAATALLAPVGAPAVLIGAAGVAAVWAVNKGFEYFTGKDAGEWIADGIMNGVEKVGESVKKATKAIGEGAKKAGKAISGWWKKTFG